MKNNKFEFPEFNDDIVENIAESYPDLSEAEKAEVCRKTHEKLDSSTDFKGDTVSGVEPARKRSWIGWTSVAVAVFAIVVIPVALKAIKNSPDMQEPETLADIDIEYSHGSPVITDYIPPEDNKESFGTNSDAPAEPTTPENPENGIPTTEPVIIPPQQEIETPPAPPENPEENDDTPEQPAIPTTEPVIIPPQPTEPAVNPPTEPKVTTWAVCSTPRKETTPVTKPAVTTWAVCSTPRKETTPVEQGTPTVRPVINDATKAIESCLTSLSYQPYTNDGLPEYSYEINGTKYQINLTSKWVWRNGTEEAVLTDEAYNILMKNVSYLGEYSW